MQLSSARQRPFPSTDVIRVTYGFHIVILINSEANCQRFIGFHTKETAS